MKKLLLLISVPLFLIPYSLFALPSPASAQTASGALCLPQDVITALLNSIGLGSLASKLITGPWYNPSLCSFRDKITNAPEDEIFGERYTYAQINWIIHSLTLNLLNNADFLFGPIDLVNKLLSSNRPLTFQDFIGQGPAGILMGTISEMYLSPPASGIQYLGETLRKFDPTPVAHAQGYGYGATTAIRPLWTASRNTAYLVMIVLLIAAGFMVMFRVKINPQTAVTLQLMIPKIIITLVLVTFSYAIAGLVIDLVFVLLTFIISVAGPASGGLVNPAQAIPFFTSPDFSRIFFYYISVWNTVGWAILIPIVGQIFGLLLTLLILWAIFKVWWMLVKTYIQLLLYIIIGPWQIMLGILPNQSGFGSWLRNMIAQASVFLVVPLMFLFNMILWQNNNIVSSVLNTIFGGPGVTGVSGIAGGATYPDLPLFGNKGLFFNFFLGYAILALTPKIAEIIRDALKVPPFKYGTAFGEALGPLRTVGGWGQAGASTATDAYTRGVYRTNPLGDLSTQAIDVARYLGVVKGKPGT